MNQSIYDILSNPKPPAPVYEYNTENKVWKAVKKIFSYIVFPISIYHYIHSKMSDRVIFAINPEAHSQPSADTLRKGVSLDSTNWEVERIAIKVDEYIIDGAIIGQKNQYDEKKWLVYANGEDELYEHKLSDTSFKDILSTSKSRGIVFNYPGVGASSGPPSWSAMIKIYKGVIEFLENEKQAQKIIGYGNSIGGSVQKEALRSHSVKEGVKYVFVVRNPYSNSKEHSKIERFFLKIFGWDIAPYQFSKKLNCPEIILKTCENEEGFEKVQGDYAAKKGYWCMPEGEHVNLSKKTVTGLRQKIEKLFNSETIK